MKCIKSLIIILFIVFICSLSIISVKAHNSNLGIEGDNNITYDTCRGEEYVNSIDIGDGYNEKWYNLVWGNIDKTTTPYTYTPTTMYHIDNDITTIYYSFQNIGREDSSITWSTGVGAENGEMIKTAYEQSMLKWNNVYYYKLNQDGIYEKHKIINLVNYDNLSDTTGITPNLLIYPCYNSTEYVAITYANSDTGISADSQISNGINHYHYTEYWMEVDLYDLNNNSLFLDRTGAHEMGHVLGLFDIDEIENPGSSSNYHHEELLMGYAKDNGLTRQSEITYKDIAGVAITRGFHTNSDHIWLRVGSTNKVICSLCNAVIENATITTNNGVSTCMGCPVYAYEQCGHNKNNLPITLENTMIPVASYGNTDYYKCKYCRYVAPFTSRQTQHYTLYNEVDSERHMIVNHVTNLHYIALENHSFNIHLAGDVYKCDLCNSCKGNNYYCGELLLNCYENSNITLHNNRVNEFLLYKISVDCSGSYTITSSADYPINISFYDYNMNEISSVVPNMTNNGCTGTINANFNNGIYYLRINYINPSNSGNITIQYGTNNPNLGIPISINSNTNMKTHLHQQTTGNYLSRSYYNNSQGAGYFKISLNAGANVTYLSGTIKVYKDSARTQLLDRYSASGINKSAISDYNENIMYLYLPDYGNYYIDVTMPNNNYSILNLMVERTDINNLDYTNNLEFISFNVLFENQNTQGCFEEVTISHKSKIQLDIATNGLVTSSIPVYIFKKVLEQGYDPGIEYYHPVLVSNNNWMITNNNSNPLFNIILDAGSYYIGYASNTHNILINFALRRIVDYDASSLGTLVTDPAYNQGFTLGSEVTFNGGLLQGTTITEGFTRCIYLMFDNIYMMPNSRLDYDWYTTNANVATVSSYGTILAKSVSQNTNVTIYAVLKEDPSVVFSVNLTILDDIETEQIEIISYLSYSYSTQNGTYKIVLNNDNSPYPWINYYLWGITPLSDFPNLEIEMSQWGFITSNGIGTAILTGEYYLNQRVVLTIYLTINP